jgi:hypothetical protein
MMLLDNILNCRLEKPFGLAPPVNKSMALQKGAADPQHDHSLPTLSKTEVVSTQFFGLMISCAHSKPILP